MKTITQYREDIAALMGKVGDIDAQCIADNRDPSAEERSLKDEMLDRVEELRDTVRTMERTENIASELKKPTHEAVSKPNPQEQRTPITAVERRDKDRFNTFGEQMAAVMRAGLPGGHVDPRLLNTRAASGLNETVASDGGFLVQQDFSSELLKNVWNSGVIAQRCRRVPISGNSNSIKINGLDETSRATGSRQGGITGYWLDEAGEKTASKPKFRKIELSLKKLIGLCYATDELLDDTAALESIISDGFRNEFAFLIDDAIINGTGAGQPLGVVNAGCLVSVTAETGQAADTVVAENVIKMWSRIFPASRGNAVWLINQNVEPQLHTMSIAAGTGGIPVYMPAGGLSGQPYATLMGRPVLAVEQCPTLGDAGDIILGDFSNGYILAEKGSIKSDMSIHVRFVYDESVFRFVIRIDGQPVLSSAVTPYKGTDTLSHFVAIAART